jgi:hypothetical protein
MPLLKSPEPLITQRRYYVRIEEPVAQTMQRYAEFLGSPTIDHVIAQAPAVRLQARRPVQVLAGAEPRTDTEASAVKDHLQAHSPGWRCPVIQRALTSKGLVSHVLACATGITLYFRWPFPEDDLMLHLISIRAPLIYVGFKYTYTLFLFTTPYIGYSFVLSGLYVFAFRPNRKIKPMPLPKNK